MGPICPPGSLKREWVTSASRKTLVKPNHRWQIFISWSLHQLCQQSVDRRKIINLWSKYFLVMRLASLFRLFWSCQEHFVPEGQKINLSVDPWMYRDDETHCLPICTLQAMATKRIQLLWLLFDAHSSWSVATKDRLGTWIVPFFEVSSTFSRLSTKQHFFFEVLAF